jgi:hypothetical protein
VSLMVASASRRSSGRVGGGQDLSAALDLDSAVAAGGSDEFLYAPTCLVHDVVADGHRGEHDRQITITECR